MLSQIHVNKKADKITIGNRFMERVIKIKDGKVKTVGLINKLTGVNYSISSDEFLIGLEDSQTLTTDDFQVTNCRRKKNQKELTVSLDLLNKELGLCVRINYQISPDDFFSRKWLEITAKNKGIFISRIDVERLTIKGVTPVSFTGRNFDCSHLGVEYSLNELNLKPKIHLGQPVFADDFFLGLEYPAGHNISDKKGEIVLRHYPGKRICPESLRSKTAVIGVSSEGGVKEKFMEYISRIRVPTASLLNWNTAYTTEHMGGLTEKNCLQLIDELKKNLYDNNDVSVDSFIIDYGGNKVCKDRWISWNDVKSVWKINADTFPHGFDIIDRRLKGLGAEVGLWYSMALVTIDKNRGGFIDQSWSQKQGYEMIDDDWYCLAGPKYLQELRKNMIEIITKYNINYLKLDFNKFICNKKDHGHLPGIYSTEAITDAKIQLIEAIREVKPSCFIKNTSGIYLSPWWLMYDNAIWMGGVDHRLFSSIPSPTARDAAITYKDSVIYDNLVNKQYPFPVSGMMMHGIIKGQDTHYFHGDKNPLQAWNNDLVMFFGRGVADHELYITPSLLTKEEWKSLAKAVKWARANEQVLLSNQRLILGNPYEMQVYGYAHFHCGKEIIIIRNPYVEPRRVRIKLNNKIGLNKTDNLYQVKIIYPYQKVFVRDYKYGSIVDIHVQGYEVIAIHIEEISSENKLEMLRGIRYEFKRRDGKELYYKVWGNPVEGKKPEYRPGEIESHVSKDRKQLRGKANIVLLANDAGSELWLLLHDADTLSYDFKNNGKKIKVRTLGSDFGIDNKREIGTTPDSFYLQSSQKKWKWFIVPLMKRENKLEFKLYSCKPLGGVLKSWLYCRTKLIEKEVKIVVDEDIEVSQPLTLPNRSDIEEKMMRIGVRKVEKLIFCN